MATIGQPLPQPEYGWMRYDDTYEKIKYVGSWTAAIYPNGATINEYKQTQHYTSSYGDYVEFYFSGSKIRIIGLRNSNRDNQVKITIDDTSYEYSEYGNIQSNTILFEKTDLTNKLHKVKIEKIINNQNFISFDAIDIEDGYEIRNPIKNTILQNEENKYFSLDNRTLINLPNASNENIVSFGMSENKEYVLSVPFTKKKYVNESSIVNTKGKIFTQDIDITNALKIEENAKKYGSLYNWHYTNMTSNNTPSPLVASASSENSPRLAWKAFQTYATSTTSDDCWLTNSGEKLGWIQLDFGMVKTVSYLKMMSRNSSTGDKPMEFSVSGSNDGTNFTMLQTFKQTIDWIGNTERIFMLDNSHNFRHYRINILGNNGHSVSGIARIQFGYKREVK